MDHALLADISLETERLIVRRLTLADAPALFAMMSDPETCSDDGGYDAVPEMDEAFMRIAAVFAKEPDRFAIVRKDTGETVGTLHLMDAIPERAVPALEIGYCMVPTQRRRGFAGEAAAAMVAHLHEKKGVPLITAGAFDFNRKSQRMLEKLGFEREGVTKCAVDHPVHGMVDMINYVHFAK
ncbi:MAG: GNAT family N-acetyltransferase [Clostridia bacterium]|nr:GNAT family N-acetyltransferase [Clostridia bacterium]